MSNPETLFIGYLFSVIALFYLIQRFREDYDIILVHSAIIGVLSLIFTILFLSGFKVVPDLILIVDVHYYLAIFTISLTIYSVLFLVHINGLRKKISRAVEDYE
jgi:hypothetical protein